jgi:hypothetical protein
MGRVLNVKYNLYLSLSMHIYAPVDRLSTGIASTQATVIQISTELPLPLRIATDRRACLTGCYRSLLPSYGLLCKAGDGYPPTCPM